MSDRCERVIAGARLLAYEMMARQRTIRRQIIDTMPRRSERGDHWCTARSEPGQPRFDGAPMSVPTAVRLPFRFDAAALAADAAALAADAWEPHFNTRQYEGDWSGVPLRIAAGGALALYPDPTSDRFEDNEPLGRCPSVIDALAQLKCPVQTVRFLRLGPGSRIKEHRDHRLSYADGELRLHVPVTTDSDVDFRVGGSTVTMAPGDVWYLDLSQSHSVTNFGVHVRVHLAIDCVVNYWLSAQLAAGSSRQAQ